MVIQQVDVFLSVEMTEKIKSSSDMKTMNKMLNESGIRKIVKIFGDDYVGGISISRKTNEQEISRIVKLIDDCCYNIAIMDPTDDRSFHLKLKEPVDALRIYFNSDYCAIGKVCGDYAEDCIVSWLNTSDKLDYKTQIRNLKKVKRASLDNSRCGVCRSLLVDDRLYLDENRIKETENFIIYKRIIGSTPINSTIFPIRDKDKTSQGFIQLINSTKEINFDDIKPFYDSLLRLILVIQRRDGLRDANSFKKDYDFISIVHGLIHNVDELLRVIMKYLSKEFGAGVVTYRIPLLIGLDRHPLFFLRECYIDDNVSKYYNKDDYFRDKLVRNIDQMGGAERFTCIDNDSLIIVKANDSDFYKKISDDGISFHEHTLIIPILRDCSGKNDCVNPHRKDGVICKDGDCCPFRFARYFGVFRLRILKTSEDSYSENPTEWLSEDVKKRLSYLSKHISVLMDSIEDKYENESIGAFQRSLKRTSFTKIKEFDEQCPRIVKEAIHTKICAFYRFKNDNLTLSATSLADNNSARVDKDFNTIINSYRTVFSIEDNDELVKKLFVDAKPIYYISNTNDLRNSIMIVPMIRKDNSKLGVMLLVGKNENNQKSSISKTFWEHDKKYIEFVIDILIRIEESDTERLTFLSQLSHELLRPISEMVFRNEYNIKTARRNLDSFDKKMLINELESNVNMCMVFKYIIEDVEYIYSLSRGEGSYDFQKVDLKEIIYESIRLFEEEASASKGLIIRTYLSNMPDCFYVDKSRMMQVFVNLLRNAIRYSNNHEEISIRYEFNEKTDCHEISFEDNGIPILKEDKDRIFNLFYRSKNAYEKASNGCGIGLYIVKQIIEAHGGRCYVKEECFPTIITIQIPKNTRQL